MGIMEPKRQVPLPTIQQGFQLADTVPFGPSPLDLSSEAKTVEDDQRQPQIEMQPRSSDLSHPGELTISVLRRHLQGSKLTDRQQKLSQTQSSNAPVRTSRRATAAHALDVPIHQEIYHDLPAIDTAVADPTKRIEYAKPKKYQATKPRIHDQQHQNCEPMPDVDLSFRSFELVPPVTLPSRPTKPVRRYTEAATLLRRHNVI